MAEIEGVPLSEEPKELIVCKWCSDEKIKKCLKCESTFCTLHASRITPDLCQECFKGVAVIHEKYNRRSQDYNPLNNTLTTKNDVCDLIRLDGPDWVWYTKWINNLNDDELAQIFEFHYFIIKLIEHHNETRKIAHTRKLASMPPIPLQTVKTTTTKTTKVTKPVDLRDELKKKFPKMPDALIDAMVAAAGQPTVVKP